MNGRQQVYEPDKFRLAHEYKAEYYETAQDIGCDQNGFAVVAVCDDACEWADQKGRQHSHGEKAADRGARLR